MVYITCKKKIRWVWCTMNDLKIKYDNGEMIVHINAFFPTTQIKFKKLLNVIARDYRNEEKHLRTLKDYFNDRINELNVEMLKSMKEYLTYRQKIVEKQEIISSEKLANGVHLKKEQLKEIKQELKRIEKMEKLSSSNYRKCKRNIGRFQKHLEILT